VRRILESTVNKRLIEWRLMQYLRDMRDSLLMLSMTDRFLEDSLDTVKKNSDWQRFLWDKGDIVLVQWRVEHILSHMLDREKLPAGPDRFPQNKENKRPNDSLRNKNQKNSGNRLSDL